MKKRAVRLTIDIETDIPIKELRDRNRYLILLQIIGTRSALVKQVSVRETKGEKC